MTVPPLNGREDARLPGRANPTVCGTVEEVARRSNAHSVGRVVVEAEDVGES